MRSQIKNYFSITKKEWNGMVVLLLLIVLIVAVPYGYGLFHKDSIINFKDFNTAVSVLDKAQKSPGDDNADKAYTSYKKAAPGVIIELNAADSAKLTELNGIGPSFAKRIISYRKRLGGFYRKDQLMEVFGLDSSMYSDLKGQVSADPSRIRKINVNTATFEALSRFPYLSYKQANAVIRFREQHGDYEALTDLKNIAIMDDKTLSKIAPYIAFK
ncbi:MAG: helix-hairpin-helix domain-containing protein [Mucilaginibacter sp.]